MPANQAWSLSVAFEFCASSGCKCGDVQVGTALDAAHVVMYFCGSGIPYKACERNDVLNNQRQPRVQST
jgi:hypothetical protein